MITFGEEAKVGGEAVSGGKGVHRVRLSTSVSRGISVEGTPIEFTKNHKKGVGKKKGKTINQLTSENQRTKN